MKYFFSILVSLIFFKQSTVAQQQDVTGLWKGEIYVDSTKQYLPYEIAVSENKGKLTGYSRIIFVEDGKEEAGFENISLKWEGNKLIIEDEGFFEHSFSKKPSKRVKKEMNLLLETSDTAMVLKGKWHTNRTRYYLVATGTTFLTRKKDFQETALFKKLDSLKIAPKLSFAQPDKMIAAAAPSKQAVKALPPPVAEEKKEVIPVPEPEVEIPLLASIDKLNTLSLLPFPKNRQPAVVKVEAPSRQKKLLFESLAKSPVVYKPKEAEVVIAEKKPAAAPQKPAAKPVIEKPAPVVAKNNPPVAEKKVETAAIVRPPAPILEKPSQQQGAAEIDKRVTKSDQSFYFESDSLLLTLYDNGEVDGDTVTVLMNGNVVFSKVGLTARANSKTIYITSNMDSVNLVMYAESLGEIPPNTGLLIVNDGEKRYDVRFSADLKTNAAIILRRKKKE